MVEVGGPEAMPLTDLIGRFLRASGDTREVIPDDLALYSGARLSERTLTPDAGARIGPMRYEDWLRETRAR